MTEKTPDNICELYSGKGVRLSLEVKAGGDGAYLLVEGDTQSLEFLGNLILSQAQFRGDCGFQILPSGAGKAFFSRNDGLGLYIHRVNARGKCDYDGALDE